LTDLRTPDSVEVVPSTVSVRRRRLGYLAVTAWCLAFVWFVWTQGFPFDRGFQTVWILTGLVAASVGRPWRTVVRIFVDWFVFVLVLYAYDYSRHFADLLGRPVMITPQIAADKLMFFGNVPTTWLQTHFYDPSATHWWDLVGSIVYVSHFLAVWVIAAILYLRNRDEWFRWARALVVLSFAGLITFALQPTAPPWYAARDGFIPPVMRISTRGLDDLGLHGAKTLIDNGASLTNDVAAIPSLHTAFAVLISVWFLPRIPRRMRWWAWPLLIAYPFAMLAMLVYSGEHYVIDGITGVIYVLGVLYGLSRWDRWRDGRRLDAETAVLDAETAALDASTPTDVDLTTAAAPTAAAPTASAPTPTTAATPPDPTTD
jgi:hypothetical protein